MDYSYFINRLDKDEKKLTINEYKEFVCELQNIVELNYKPLSGELEIFKLVLKRDKNFVPALTNIAILYDTIEDYEKAIIYYRKAIQQDQRLLNRMSWFKRFIKNIHFKPSTIQERLFYLENQLGLESNERVLKNIEIDKLQPDYQM